MNVTTYSAWKSDQLKVLAVATQEQRERYLRGIGNLWGECVAADVEAAAGRAPGCAAHSGENHGQENAHEARQAWEKAQARLLEKRNERIAQQRRAHPLNAGSRALARDPAVILEQAQARTCKGCRHEYRITFTGNAVYGCQLGHGHGLRCCEYWDRHEPLT